MAGWPRAWHARDAQGPKIGALGHPAGGYTVLALAGGTPDLARLARHCQQESAADPVFCRTAQAGPPGFDRRAFLAQLAAELPMFFDNALR